MSDQHPALIALIREKMEQYDVPGVAVGLLHEGRLFTAGFGVTNVDHPLAVTADTLFQIGSNTKTMTATLLMMLAEDGLVDLDAPVSTYIPAFRVADDAVSAAVTVTHLLTHSAGWTGDLFEDTGMGDDAIARYVQLMADLPQLAPIGTHFSYNNSAFNVAGLIVERVTGRPYETVLKERLFEPLGMSHSFFAPGDVMVHRFAVGHYVGPEGPGVATPWPLPRCAWPAGGATCSAGDLMAYARFYLDGGTVPADDGEPRRLISADGMRALWTPRFSTGGMRGEVALSWFVDPIGGVPVYSHGGGTVGQVSTFAIVPEKQLAYCLLTNANRGGQLNGDVEKWLLEAYGGLVAPEPAAAPTAVETLRALVGTYSRPMVDLALTLDEEQLQATMTFKHGFPSRNDPPPPAPPPIPLGMTADGDLLALGGPYKGGRAQVLRRDDGSIGWIRMGGRIHVRKDEG